MPLDPAPFTHAAELLTLALLALPLATCAAPGSFTPPPGWSPSPTLIADLAEKKTPWLFREQGVPSYTLPDPLALPEGARVQTARDWEQKLRPATFAHFERDMFGRTPAKPAKLTFDLIATDPKAMQGQATLKVVRITATDAGRSYSFETACFVPNAAKGPVPAMLLINIREPKHADYTRQVIDDFWPAEEIIRRGYATAVFHASAVDPDYDGDYARAHGVRAVFTGPGREGEDAWATLGAWAWGASRVLDYLETDPAIDAKRVAVVGHSRGGKTALWAGAQDPRFAMVCCNESGCGGAALARRCFGETIKIINGKFPYWFCGNFKKYNDREANRPVDQHQLLALIAPRPLYVTAADEDLWGDPRGQFLALAHASPVYALYGHPTLSPDEMPGLNTPLIRGPLAFHIRTGKHDLNRYDWDRFLDFADKHLRRQ